jgi:antirestriction protein ArdC
MKQANEVGGSVRKGEHGQIVVFWKVDEIANVENNTGPETDEVDEKSRRHFALRYYRLFNLEQCELPQAVFDKLPKIETHQHHPIEAAERIIAGMPNPPEIQYAGSKAFYSPTTDRITLPPRELFISAEEHFGTLAHEMSHAAGAPKRLNRKSISEAAPFGSPTYSVEELVAEFSAAYLCAEAGISPAVLENQVAYIQGWLAK